MISGFLSQEDDKFSEWMNMIEHLKESQTALYDFKWESQIPASILQGLQEGAKSAFGSVSSIVATLTRTLSTRYLLGLSAVVGTVQVVNGIANVFKQSKANAKLAGTLLGCTLALREPFHSQTVSLLGFSLGC